MYSVLFVLVIWFFIVIFEKDTQDTNNKKKKAILADSVDNTSSSKKECPPEKECPKCKECPPQKENIEEAFQFVNIVNDIKFSKLENKDYENYESEKLKEAVLKSYGQYIKLGAWIIIENGFYENVPEKKSHWNRCGIELKLEFKNPNGETKTNYYNLFHKFKNGDENKSINLYINKIVKLDYNTDAQYKLNKAIVTLIAQCKADKRSVSDASVFLLETMNK